LIDSGIRNFYYIHLELQPKSFLRLNEYIVLFLNYHTYIASKRNSPSQTGLDCPGYNAILTDIAK